MVSKPGPVPQMTVTSMVLFSNVSFLGFYFDFALNVAEIYENLFLFSQPSQESLKLVPVTIIISSFQFGVFWAQKELFKSFFFTFLKFLIKK